MRKLRKKEIGYIIGAVLTIIVLLLPIKITNHIKSEAKIIPAREWILQKLEDGSIQIIDKDYQKNLVHSISAYQVVRGDFVEFKMNEELANRNKIFKNEIIGTIESISTERELANLKRDLNEAESYLRMSKTGEKETAITMAREIVNKSKIQLENQNIIADRKKKLFEKNIISQEEYEIEKNLADLYKYELLEAEANLANLKAGAKPEEIALYQDMVQATRQEIQHIYDLKEKFTLRAPLDGQLYRIFSTDTLLIIGDTLSVAVIPVRSDDMNRIQIGQTFTLNLQLDETGSNPMGTIINVNKITEYIDQRATVLITGRISDSIRNLPLNAVLGCTIKTESVLLRDYIFDFIISVFK
ncbi:MAG: hypothetical protein JW956_05770 [Calditrichaceae bacterium]|nr:hypothetical protein [Calditrichaceae bacterium]